MKNNFCKLNILFLTLIPCVVNARGSLGLPTTIDGISALLLIVLAIISWNISKIFSIISVALLISIIERSFNPIIYTVSALSVLILIFAMIALPIAIYYRKKEKELEEQIAKSEVKWIRTADGLQKFGSVIFYPNEHFVVIKENKIGIKILYPKQTFIFAEEIENFYLY
jgi:hypothetical protein